MSKKTILLLAILVSGSMALASGNGTEEVVNEEVSVTDFVVSAQATVIENKAYVNIKMLNETKQGAYSLVRFNCDGTVTSIGLKDATPNTINQPLMYCFVDEELACEEASYVLVRIGAESEVIQTWTYNPDLKIIVADEQADQTSEIVTP